MYSVETLEGLHTRARDLHDLARHTGTSSRRPLRRSLAALSEGALNPLNSLPWGPRR